MTSTAAALPGSCAVAFKEWSGVCEALADGRQSLILRKGGIAEEAGRFIPEHEAFWLYPTRLHERQQGLRIGPAAGPAPPASHVDLPALALVHAIGYLDRPGPLEALADLHVWTEETVARRFHYRSPGLWVLGVRVFRAEPARRIEVTPAQAGCKSWVVLDAPLPTAGLRPALGEAEFSGRMERLNESIRRADPTLATGGLPLDG